MTDFTKIKKIGYAQAFKAITVGLIIAYIIMALMDGPFWLFRFRYAPTILFAAVMIYIAGYFIGRLMAVWILKHKQLAILFGIIGGFLIVWTATFIGSLIGFIKEGLPNQNEMSEPVYYYIYKPIAVVTMYGFFPIILVGTWFGLSIKKKGDKIIKS
ncbi:MAG: hypothetical protein ABI237_12055 [Ginsengibacter sp.]